MFPFWPFQDKLCVYIIREQVGNIRDLCQIIPAKEMHGNTLSDIILHSLFFDTDRFLNLRPCKYLTYHHDQTLDSTPSVRPCDLTNYFCNLTLRWVL